MAEKWADYLISAVRYNAPETHIDALRLHEDKGNTVGSPTEVSRQRIVEFLEAGTNLCTIYKGDDNKWRRGAPVGIITIDGIKYIRTDADRIKADNLGDLPRF
jgi:Protein of unknown function (DUF3892)